MVTREPIDALPARLAVVIIAGASAALIYFVVLPERPQAELERLRHAIRDGIERVLARIAAAVQAGAWTDATHRELHRDVYRLGEIVMLAQTRVAALGRVLPNQGGRWLHLLAIELATERVARAAVQDLGTPAERGALLASLAGIARRYRPAAAAIGRRARHRTGPARPRAARAAAAGSGTGSRATAEHVGPGMRPSIQTAIAAALAIIGGELVSPDPLVLGRVRGLCDVPGHPFAR